MSMELIQKNDRVLAGGHGADRASNGGCMPRRQGLGYRQVDIDALPVNVGVVAFDARARDARDVRARA
jgi:hypothetical protein